MAVDIRGLAQLGPHCGKGFTQLLTSYIVRPQPDSVNRIKVSMDTALQAG